MKEYKLSESIVNQILNYLKDKPFVEVAGLINSLVNELNNSQEIEEK